MTLLNPVDEKRALTLSKLATVAESQGLNVLLLGAFARDLLFWHMRNIECRRATMDVDIVVQLKDWTAYHKYRRALVDLGFKEDEAESRSLCRGDFNRARMIIRDILDGLNWRPAEGSGTGRHEAESQRGVKFIV
ncbi:MAG: hypothetical protein WCI20_10340 [bacterium]